MRHEQRSRHKTGRHAADRSWFPCVRRLSCLVATLAALAAAAGRADAYTVYAVTAANQLIRFDSGSPGTTLGTVAITGLAPGETILAMDIRPFTGQIYVLGSSNRLYIVQPTTGVASALPELSVVLTGAAGLDVDPVTDDFRIVTTSGQNLRLDNTGAIVSNGVVTAAGIAAVAYTNNFAAPDRATLYGIDAAVNELVRIGGLNLPDNGASQDAGVVSRGPWRLRRDSVDLDVSDVASLDITTHDNGAYAVINETTGQSLCRLTLPGETNPGTVTCLGVIAAPQPIVAMAILTRATVIYGLTTTNAIVTFLSAVPGTLLPQPSGAPVPITGLAGGETILGIDVRPATGGVYGLSSQNRLYRIDPASGAATLPIDVSSAGLTGTTFALDFDPVVDRLRVFDQARRNVEINVDSGVVTPHAALARPVLAAAYTNNVANAASTVLLGIDTKGDATGDRLVRVGSASPNDGTVVDLGASTFGVNSSNLASLDIAPADGSVFAALTAAPSGTSSALYLIDRTTGSARVIGTIGGGAPIRGIATASPGRLQFSAPIYTVQENVGTAIFAVQRIGGAEGPVEVTATTANGTARAPDDYVAIVSRIAFASGDMTPKILAVTIHDDTLQEPDETLTLALSSPTLGATLGTNASAAVVIKDNDTITIGQPTIQITSPVDAEQYTATSAFVTLGGVASDTDGTIAGVTWTTDRGLSGAASGTDAWTIGEIPLSRGVNTITVDAVDNAGQHATDTLVVIVDALSYYLAEGSTGGFFDLDILIANPNAQPVPVTITYLKPAGVTVQRDYTLPATSRTTILVDDIPQIVGEVSAIVTSTGGWPIVVERTMRWDQTGYGAHTEKATDGLALKWYFAEGSQGFFYTYLLLANPSGVPNRATVTYLRENALPFTATYDLLPFSRRTIGADTEPVLFRRAFGMEVVFDHPGVAERAMYFGFDPLFTAGHESAGVTTPSTSWFLAEGATGPFFETFILMANPNTTKADATVTFLPSTGVPVERRYEVPARSRTTVNVELQDASLANAAVATKVESTLPIVVERAQYWPFAPDQWYEAHNSFGVTATATKWGLAEGRVGGPLGYQTFILLANPGTEPAVVTVTFLRENGTTLTKQYTVQPTSRFNVEAGSPLAPELRNERFGAVISSTKPIAVERAMYSNTPGLTWSAGTNATATRLP